MILISGASGKTGKAIIQRLLMQGAKVRAWVHHPDSQAALVASGVAEVVCGDLHNPDAIRQAVNGVDSIYHICPNMSPDELAIGRLMVRAARKGGVQHFVYHSVLHPQAHQMPHHWHKLQVETEILTSGLEYTILQPTAYMQNMQAYWPKILKEGVYQLPYAAESRISLVDLNDVAEAAAKVLTDSSYRNGLFELVGTPAFSQTEMTQKISAKLGKEVRLVVQPRQEWEAQARQNGMPEFAIQTLLKMFRYYEAYGMGGNPRVLMGILNRQPVSYEQYLDRLLARTSS